MASELAEKLTQTNEPLYGFVANEPGVEDVTWEYVLPFALGAKSLIQSKFDSLLPTAQGFLLQKSQPLFKFFDNSLNLYGRMGKDYFKTNIQPYRDYSKVLKDYIYYPGKQAGKIRYKYMDQFPTLRENIRNSDFSRYIRNKKPRKDSSGFDNLKVNFDGEDFAYQVRNNPRNNHKEFYNIKPFELAEKDYQEQQYQDYLLKMFEKLPEEY